MVTNQRRRQGRLSPRPLARGSYWLHVLTGPRTSGRCWSTSPQCCGRRSGASSAARWSRSARRSPACRHRGRRTTWTCSRTHRRGPRRHSGIAAARTRAGRVRRSRGARPVPNLLGALLLEADATRLHDPDRHLLDVAFLTSLVIDPLGMRGELTGSDPRRLRTADTHHTDADHRAWRVLGRERQRAAYATWRLLVDGA